MIKPWVASATVTSVTSAQASRPLRSSSVSPISSLSPKTTYDLTPD